jgi:hypothetical protein
VICPQCQIEHPCLERVEIKRGLIIYPENLAAHRASGESAQRRRWYDTALRRWLSGRKAPQLHEC